MNSNASTTLLQSSTSELQENSWIPSAEPPSSIVPLGRFQYPCCPYFESAIHQTTAEIPQKQIQVIKVVKLKMKLHELLQVVASPSAADLRGGQSSIESEAKSFTGFTDAEREESEKTVGIKSNILRNFYDHSDQSLGGTGNIFKEDKGMMKAILGTARQVKEYGIGQWRWIKMKKVDIGKKNVSAVIENGDMNCCIATTEDKVGKRENEADYLSIPVSAAIKTTTEEAYTAFKGDHSCYSVGLKKPEDILVRRGRRESSESLSSSLEVDSDSTVSEDDDNGNDYDWISVDGDGKRELYETGMLPPAYPKTTLVGCKEKHADDGGDDDVERGKNKVSKSEGNRSMETGGMFGVSKMLITGSLDSAIMRFQMDDSTTRFDHNVDKLLTSYSSDQSFRWNPPKQNPDLESVSVDVLSPKPNMQCIRCKKFEYADGLSESVMRSFICYNCVEFGQHSAILDSCATASLLKHKLTVAAAPNRTALKKRRKRR